MLLCQPNYLVLMGTPHMEHENKLNSKQTQHESKHPSLHHPWKCSCES